MNIEEIKDRVNKTKNAFHKLGIEGQVNINVMLNDIEFLLTAYEKEKEKNKTLEELLQGRLFELYKYYKDLASEYQANCVSKSKIKPIQIIDLDGKIHNVYKIEEE
jgi:hypothetical protein